MLELTRKKPNGTDIIELTDIDSDGEVCISIEEQTNNPFLRDAMTAFHVSKDHAIQIINHLKKEFEI